MVLATQCYCIAYGSKMRPDGSICTQSISYMHLIGFWEALFESAPIYFQSIRYCLLLGDTRVTSAPIAFWNVRYCLLLLRPEVYQLRIEIDFSQYQCLIERRKLGLPVLFL